MPVPSKSFVSTSWQLWKVISRALSRLPRIKRERASHIFLQARLNSFWLVKSEHEKHLPKNSPCHESASFNKN